MASNAVNFLATGTDATALALKIYSGVFSEAYRNQPKLWNRPSPGIHRKTDASGSKSYQWLKFAETPAADEDYHPGDTLLGQGFAVDEGSNSVDTGYIVAHHVIPRYDMAISHFEVLSKLARADARQIGMIGDKRLLITTALAARSGNSTSTTGAATATTKNGLNVDNGGNRVTRIGASVAGVYPLSATGAANFRADARALAYAMDTDNIPREGREMWITPYIEQVLLYDNTAQLFSKDYTYDGEGNKINTREVRLLEGFRLIECINTATNGGTMPDANVTTGPSRYRGNFSLVSAAAVGTPVAIVLATSNDGAGAVSVGTWDQVGHTVKYYEKEMCWFVSSGILSGMSIMNAPCAGSIEVLLT